MTSGFLSWTFTFLPSVPPLPSILSTESSVNPGRALRPQLLGPRVRPAGPEPPRAPPVPSRLILSVNSTARLALSRRSGSARPKGRRQSSSRVQLWQHPRAAGPPSLPPVWPGALAQLCCQQREQHAGHLLSDAREHEDTGHKDKGPHSWRPDPSLGPFPEQEGPATLSLWVGPRLPASAVSAAAQDSCVNTRVV